MKRHLCKAVILLAFGVFLISCGSKKDLAYFQDAEYWERISHLNDSAQYDIRIRSNDNLLITVSSVNPLAAEQFNVVSLDRGGSSTNLEWQGYLVDDAGYINFPRLGKIKVSGMTKDELIALLEERIKAYFADPVVNVRFLNYSVTVMGEVARPGDYTVKDEKITILQALSMAGDLTIYGERDNVLVSRVENGKKNFYRLNLKDPAIFNSPAYYLQQNDVVYVSPNKAQAGRAVYNQTWGTVISISSLAVSLATMIISLSK